MGLKRYMAVLGQFDERRPSWTVPDLAAALEMPASSVYRLVRHLLAQGLLERSDAARYRLGPAFIAFDRVLRLTDPLARLGTPALEEIVRQAPVPCVGLLCRLYGEEVMCIADAAAGSPAFRPSYERGRPMPLVRGATSKVILAALPARRRQKLLTREGAAGMAGELAEIRKQGFRISRSEIDPGLVGIAAPIAGPGAAATASLSLVVAEAALTPALEARLHILVVSSASLLSAALLDAEARS